MDALISVSSQCKIRVCFGSQKVVGWLQQWNKKKSREKIKKIYSKKE